MTTLALFMVLQLPASPPTAVARTAVTPPVIDGRLTDPAWAGAPVVTDWVML